MKTKVIFFISNVLIMFLAVSCLKPVVDEEYTVEGEGEVIIPDENFDANTQPVSIENAINITFSDGQTEVDNPFEGKGVTINVDGQCVTVTSTVSGTEVNYVLSGITGKGFVKIYSDYKFGLIFNGVSIQNPAGAAINIQSGKNVSVTLADQTSNRLIDGGTYQMTSGEDMKAAFFSEGQLVFGGTGSLLVYGNHKHAICSDDYIQITSGSITVNNAATDGIHCNTYFQMDGGSIDINAKSDGVECEGGYVTVNGGTIRVNNSGQGGKGVKSAGNMTFAGGDIHLSITGNAYYDSNDADIKSPAGVKCNGDMVITGDCTLTVNSTGSAGKGVSVDGTLTFDGGATTINTSGAAFRYNNRFDSSAKAVKSKGNMTVNAGTIIVKTEKSGAEGLESKRTLVINGGKAEIEAYDDAINAATNITINGGEVYCYSIGNDGIDANGPITITGGLVVSSGTNSPEEGFDCDNKTFTITGGTAVGVGGSTSMPTTNACTQRVVVWGTSGFTAGQPISIKSSNDSEVLTFKLPRTYSGSMTLVFTSPLLQANTGYTIYKGGNVSGGSDFHGLYSDAVSSGGTSAATFTTSSMVTTVGNVSTGPGGGGRPW